MSRLFHVYSIDAASFEADVRRQAPTIVAGDVVRRVGHDLSGHYGVWPCALRDLRHCALSVRAEQTRRHNDAIAHFSNVLPAIKVELSCVMLELLPTDAGLRRLATTVDARPDAYDVVLYMSGHVERRLVASFRTERRNRFEVAAHHGAKISQLATEEIDRELAPSTEIMIGVHQRLDLAFALDGLFADSWMMRGTLQTDKFRVLRVETRDGAVQQKALTRDMHLVSTQCPWRDVASAVETIRTKLGDRLWFYAVAGLDCVFQWYSTRLTSPFPPLQNDRTARCRAVRIPFSLVGLHDRLVGVALVLATRLETYVLLALIDWLPGMQCLPRATKVAALHRITRRVRTLAPLATHVGGRTRGQVRKKRALQSIAFADEQ